MPPIETANWKALFLYLSYWRSFPWLTLGSICFSIVLALQITILPLLVAVTLGQLIHSHVLNTGLLVFTGCFQFALVLLAYLLDANCVAVLHGRVEERLYQDAFQYLVYQDYSFFANRFSGSLVTQASRFAKVYSTFHDTMFFDLIPQLTTVLVAVIVMSHYNLLIGGTTFLLWLFATFVVVKLALLRLPMRRSAVARESQQVGELADTITNALTVKTFAAEQREIKRYDALNQLRGRLFLQSWRRAVRNGWIVEALCSVIQLFVFVGGLYAVYHNKIGVATFLLFQVYIFRIIDNIRRSSWVVRQLEVVSGDAQEMTELFEQPPQVQDAAATKLTHIGQGAINFNDVTFQYEDANTSEELFDKLNLAIQPGEKVGLVGPSGGGKTTITRLLLRFMDLQGGTITIDGQDIRQLKQRDVRQAIAYVPQEPLLFHRSIQENIRYGQPTASQADVKRVAKKSFADDFITALPARYDTLVGERGVKLSGGQRQRIAIARAMLANAPVLVLDEATSALDSQSERVIQKALWELMKDKTAVVIAHRLSTIQRLDRIIVIDNGQVVEQGPHQELLKKKGLYAKLWAHQSGDFLEEAA